MVTIVNNNVYLKFAKRVDLKCSHHTHKKWLTMGGDEYVIYFDCGNHFTKVYVHQNIMQYTSNMYNFCQK